MAEDIKQMVEDLLNQFDCQCEALLNNGEECNNQADVQWMAREDGELYYTYRCDLHPVINAEFQEVEL